MAARRVRRSKLTTLRCILLLAATLLILLTFLTLPALATGPPGSERVMIMHRPGAAGQAAADRAVHGAGGRIVEWVPGTDLAVALVPEQALAGLARAPGVLAVEPDATVQILGSSSGAAGKSRGLDAAIQSDETIGWNITRIGAEASWTTSQGRDVNVAILDTGIDLDHPDLMANIEGGYMAIQTGPYSLPGQQTYDDDNNHGTHVAGIVAAVGNNGTGVVGVAPEADLYAVKVLDQDGNGYLSDIIEGIRWAIATRSDGNPDNDIQVINMSFGTTSNVWFLDDALIDAESAGIMLVAAAGNNGPSLGTVLYPAAYPSVVAVGATDQQDVVASFSSRGSQVELSAPGVSILSTIATGGYQTYSGTSMASPHVTGAAALFLEADPSATPVEVTVSLAAHAEDLGPYGRDSSYGFGLVRVDRSLASITPPDPNSAPIAEAQSVSTAEGTSVPIYLSGSDVDGDMLTFAVASDPVYGTLSEFDPTSGRVVYTPTPGYVGDDSFTFTVYDGILRSDPATVSISVTAAPANVMHIYSIDMATKKAGRNVSALATVTVVDGHGDPVAGAMVSGHWSVTTWDLDSGITDAAGQVTFESNKVKSAKSVTTFTFSVDEVTLAGWTYESSANEETSDSITYSSVK